MSETSSIAKMNPKESTRATSVSPDTESVLSVVQMPGAPPPTRTHTVAGNLPDHDYIISKLSGVQVNTPPTSVRAGTEGTKMESVKSEESATFMEANNWVENAEEDFTNALKRIATTAEDEHQADPGKSVQEYYSLRVAKLLKEGPIEFDVKYFK